MTMTPEALLAAAYEGTLNLDADADQVIGAAGAPAVASPETPTPTNAPAAEAAPAQPAGAPAAAAGAGTTTAQEDAPVGTPIASRSGEYTIPYEQLVKARTARDTLATENAALKAQLEQLTRGQQHNLAQAQADAAARADAGAAPTTADKNLAIAQTAASQGVDMSLFGDFSEEAIAKGVAAMVEARVQAALAPLQQREQVNALDAHARAIYSAHPDADEIAESAQFKQWVDAQPAFARTAIEQVIERGTAADVVEVLNTFKQAHTATNAPAQPGRTGNPVDAAVAKAVQRAEQQVPISLSDLTGAAAGASEAERLQALSSNPAALLNAVGGLSSDKLDALMNSVA
ncbi:hypothetical protein [Delftia sp. PS-11]|uniref:hypothetical protein n=1 Tax=Delftia sp. PS-11 TaxID=2767222 RepID=UPI00245901AF|nr:hypothetical protein [Delftia sp. PS-11]KAJ8741818.1 hypothetical protein H9T68_20870 [Delftia sp. PS-11]